MKVPEVSTIVVATIKPYTIEHNASIVGRNRRLGLLLRWRNAADVHLEAHAGNGYRCS